MECLYTFSLPKKSDHEKLYITEKRGVEIYDDRIVFLERGDYIDFSTYFNAFSARKWKTYTTLNNFLIKINGIGKFKVEIYSYQLGKKGALKDAITFKNEIIMPVDLDDTDCDLIGVRLIAESEMSIFYTGGFWTLAEATLSRKRIGISICTFKREQYILKNLEILNSFCKVHSEFNITVIDNGRTLVPGKIGASTVLHNPNYGGSGGFTRALIEQIDADNNDYVLLMDDDIEIEVSSLERLSSFLSYLKKCYCGSMISGAMLNLERPCEQHENTAYLGKLRLHSIGRMDLDNIENLCMNEHLPQKENAYAGWWFACIPLIRVQEVGYPLPIFIKADDIEYGLRLNQRIITLNGIGVWHQPFSKKENFVVNYFSDRNMLMLHHYAKGCNRWTFLNAVMLRAGKRFLMGNRKGLEMFQKALNDYSMGLNGITATPADEFFDSIKNYTTSKSLGRLLFETIYQGVQQFMQYNLLHSAYIDFRSCCLRDKRFWLQYLQKSKVYSECFTERKQKIY